MNKYSIINVVMNSKISIPSLSGRWIARNSDLFVLNTGASKTPRSDLRPAVNPIADFLPFDNKEMNSAR